MSSFTVKSLTVRSALEAPTLSSNAFEVSFQKTTALSSAPRSIVTPASAVAEPVAFELRTMLLSSMFTVSDRVVVTEPDTVRLPSTVALPVTLSEPSVAAPAVRSLAPKSPATPNVAVVSESVNFVAVALSSIPVEAKVEIVPPSILSPEI